MSRPAFTKLPPKTELDFVTREVFDRQAELKSNMDAMHHCLDQVRIFKGMALEFDRLATEDAQMLHVMLQRKWALEAELTVEVSA